MMRVLLAALFALTTGLFQGLAQAAGEPASVAAYGYAQLTAEPIVDGGRNGIAFGADRMRLGGKYRQGSWFGAAEIDFNNGAIENRGPGTLPNIITDMYVGYFYDNALIAQVGQFKIPVGMDFSTPGNELDFAKRGLDRALMLDRTLGAMISGRNILGWFGYDLGVFNTAGRAVATLHTTEQVGDINAVAGRLSFDYGETLHLEASLGASPEAAGEKGTTGYYVTDIGGILRLDRWTTKAELAYGSNIRGVDDWTQQTVSLHIGYRVSQKLELMTRIYSASATREEVDYSLQNTFLGASYYIGDSRTHRRLQLNYILASGDVNDWNGNGIGGFLSDAFLLQVQIAFDGLIVGGK